MAHDAREQLKEQMGPDFEDVDWTKYDPRQYDPRRIVREALMDAGPLDGQPDKPQSGPMALPPPIHDADKPTPWDGAQPEARTNAPPGPVKTPYQGPFEAARQTSTQVPMTMVRSWGRQKYSVGFAALCANAMKRRLRHRLIPGRALR